MDPALISGSLATIVGLMADFATSRGHRDVLEIKEFVAWLRIHGHEELVEKLERNAAATASVKAALAEGKTELLTRLARIEALLAMLTRDQGALHALAVAVSPTVALSQQAIEILLGFESADAGKALFVATLDEEFLVFLDGKSNAAYHPTDPRFFEVDLRELAKLHLVEPGFNASGGKLFMLTRRGSEVARVLGPPGTSASNVS